MGRVEIVTYSEGLAKDFERLNRAWIERYFNIEEADLKLFRNPRESIIETGGQIFFARIGDLTVGTCAAQKLSVTEWELAKLGVHEQYQRQGIGRLLCKSVIDFCWNQGASRIVIETNSALKPALSLYYDLGFTPFVPKIVSEFARADVFLELFALQR